MNTEQAAAIDVFRELGWVGTTSEQWPTLPIGTSQQRRIARDGLKSRDWDERDPEAFRLRSTFPDDIDCIALLAFAIRCGITARRAVSLRWSRLFSNDVHVALLSERGPRFAADYINRESSGHDIADVQETPRHGPAWLQLVRDLDLEPPRRLGYAVAWTTLALKALNGESDPQPFKAEAEEHLSLAVEVRLPPHGALGDLLLRDLLPRERRLDVCLAGLESASRPSDRADWGRLLADLEITDDEVREHADLLLGALAVGEGPLLEGLGTRCATALGDEYLPDLLVITGAARTQKAAKALLSALAGRPRPEQVAGIEPLLADLLLRDGGIAKAARRLHEAWGIDSEAPEAETELLPWLPVPPTWQVPAFDPGPATAEHLTELAAALERSPDPLLAERFVATLHAVVRRDPQEAELALGGLNGVNARHRLGLDVYAKWQQPLLKNADHADEARERDLGPRLAEVPVVVSLPSRDDLTIDPEDLLDRLQQFDEAGVAVPAGDLYWALLRLDTTAVTEDLISRARMIRANVRFADGSALRGGTRLPVGPTRDLTAGQALAQLMEHPLVEPWDDDKEHLTDVSLAEQPGLTGWPIHVREYWGFHYLLPRMSNLLIRSVHFDEGMESARQTARHGHPLTRRTTVNLLALVVNGEDRARAFEAAVDAWKRGLLLPERFRPRSLPNRLAAWAIVLRDLAEAGALALSWRVLDELLALAAVESRLPAGTKELVTATAHLTESVLAAVEAGSVPASVLDQSGLRGVAGRSGSSEAVKLAREIVGRLPRVNGPKPAGTTIRPWRYEDVWNGDPVWKPIDDGISVKVVEVKERTTLLLTTGDGTRYTTPIGWTHDLAFRRQRWCVHVEAGAGVWLWWDSKRRKLRVSDKHRSMESREPLSNGLVAVAVASCSSSSDYYWLGELLRTNTLAPATLAAAMPSLLPALATPLLRGVEKNQKYCHVLWPIVTEAIAYAGAQKTPPRWSPRALTLALQIAPVLQEAARRGKIAPVGWEGLDSLVSARGKTGERARKLRELVATISEAEEDRPTR